MKKTHTGFTLIELLITIALAGLLLTLGVPAFNDTIRNNRLTTQANNLVAAFNLARGEAIKRRLNITVCASSDLASCSGAWQDGWIVMETASGDLLRVFDPMKGSTTVTATAVSVQYTPEGFLDGGAPVTLSLCAESGKAGRQINITATGRTNNVLPHPTC